MLVMLKRTATCPVRLTRGTLYLVVGIDDSNFRIVNDGGDPVLCPSRDFDVVEASLPEDWIRIDFPDGEYFIDPPDTSAPGFYEDVADAMPDAVAVFKVTWTRLNAWQDGLSASSRTDRDAGARERSRSKDVEDDG